MAKLKIVHLIIGLGKGGAETMLYQVVSKRQDEDLEHLVVSLGSGDYYEEKIRDAGVEVVKLNLKKHPISTIFRLCKILKGADVLSCWMYHANYLGYIFGKRAKVKRIIWNIRHSDLSKKFNKKRTLKINKWCAKRSKKVAVVAYNGYRARKVHEEFGYFSGNGVVMNNGVDTSEFFFDEGARQNLVQELGIDNGKKIILSVTKFHPIKDVPTFISAFSKLHAENADCVAVACGNGIDGENRELTALCEENSLKVGEDIFFLGMRHDIPKLLSACDLYVLHSAGEAFPNTLVQAMACECKCITTDVGDSKLIIGNDDCVIQSQNVDALHEKMQEFLGLSIEESEKLKKANRQRVLDNYSIDCIVKNYENLFKGEIAE